MNLFTLMLAIYFLNFFFGLKLLLHPNINLSNNIFTLILIIIFPFLTPIIYLFVFFDEQARKHFLKKQSLDINNIPNLNDKTLTQHNELTFFTNGEELFEDIFEEIKNAKHYIHISFFTFSTDRIGKLFIKKLEEKLKENVEVIIMYDPLGSYSQRKKYFNNYKKLGGKLIPFVKFKIKYPNLNYRNHRKYIIIDNKIAYLGGFNISDKYLGRNKKLGLWIDSEIKILGSAVSNIEKRFLADLMYCKKEKVNISKYLIEHEFTGNKQIEIISSGADISQINHIENKIIQYIYNAEKYIYIQTPYLILNDNFIKALKYAESKGVDIKIMLPNKNDHPFVLQATKAYAALFVDSNIKIYLFNKNAFLHSKVFVCDDHYVSIGTTNLDIRSFKFSLETNAFITDKSFAQLVKEVFIKQTTYCTLYTKTQIEKQNIFIKIYFNACKLLSNIL